MPVHSSSLARELIEALGLPKNCRSIEIRLAAGEIITVRCEHYPDRNPMLSALSVITTYQLGPALAEAEHLGDAPTTEPPAGGATTTEGSKDEPV